MDYVTTGVGFADLATPGDAWVGVRYGFPGAPRIVVMLVDAHRGDVEARLTVGELGALAEAIAAATQRAFGSRPPRRKRKVVIACTDMDTQGEGRVVVQEGESSVAVNMAIPDQDMYVTEVAMGQGEAAALIGILEAALRWMAEYRPQR